MIIFKKRPKTRLTHATPRLSRRRQNRLICGSAQTMRAVYAQVLKKSIKNKTICRKLRPTREYCLLLPVVFHYPTLPLEFWSLMFEILTSEIAQHEMSWEPRIQWSIHVSYKYIRIIFVLDFVGTRSDTCVLEFEMGFSRKAPFQSV